MNERTDGHVATDWDREAETDTIALLQEEIARLEAELSARDEALLHPAADHEFSAAPSDGLLARQVEALTADLARSEETVNLLLEQTLLFEEAAIAQRAEWDQLNRWVEEVERRVEDREGSPSESAPQLAAAEVIQQQWNAERRKWVALRERLDSEIAHLRGLIDHGGDGSAIQAVEEENRRLRAAVEEPPRFAAAAEDADDLRRRLGVASAELELSRASVTAIDDERRRERNELEAEITALRSKIARDLLQPIATVEHAGPDGLAADERIRAFRHHLKDLHEREAEERAKLTFSARLSRLWRNTGPSA